MSLQSAGEALAQETPRQEEARKERELLHEQRLIRLLSWSQSRSIRGVAEDLFDKTGPKSLARAEAFIDEMVRCGWVEKTELVATTHTVNGSRPGERTVSYEVTAKGKKERDDRIHVRNERKQQEWELEWLAREAEQEKRMIAEGGDSLRELEQASPLAQQIVDYLVREDPLHPNQAHFAAELGCGAKEIREALDELQQIRFTERVKARKYYWSTTPTYYQLDYRGLCLKLPIPRGADSE